MKAFKTIISIVFIVGSIAIIIYDSRTNTPGKVVTKSVKTDSLVHSKK